MTHSKQTNNTSSEKHPIVNNWMFFQMYVTKQSNICSTYILRANYFEFSVKYLQDCLRTRKASSLHCLHFYPFSPGLFSLSSVDLVMSVKVIISVGRSARPFPKTRWATFPKHSCLLKAHSSVIRDVHVRFANSTPYKYTLQIHDVSVLDLIILHITNTSYKYMICPR